MVESFDDNAANRAAAGAAQDLLRLRNQDALLEAGALQSAIFNSENFSSIATDAKGVIQIFNVGAQRMLGYSAMDMMNRITPADISDPQELIERAAALSLELGTPIMPGFEALVFKAARGIEDIYELTYIRKDGSRFPAVVSVTALRNDRDAIIGYLLIGTDNTARKRAELALLKAGALQHAIFNSANFSSIATDAKGVIQIFNVGAQHMLGYSALDVMNKITPADISDLPELIARAAALSDEFATRIRPGFETLVFKAARGIEDIYELTYIRKDGSRFPAVVSVTALRDDQDAIIGYLLIGTDNTARKRAELALLKAGALQQAIFNSANFSSVATDAKGVIQIFNVGAEHMLGYAAADVVNRITPADISDPQELNVRAAALSLELGATINPGFEALVFKAARGIEDIYELTYIRKDGSRFPAVVSVTALRDDQNAIIGYLLIGTDNTARKQAEAARDSFAAQLRESQKMEAIGILAGGIAHDFNNALATISGNVELACQDLDRDSPALESLDEIRKAGLRMRDLVQQILSFSRRQPTERKRTSLAPIIEESARLLRATMPARMRLVVDCEAGVPDVMADVTQIEQVLINLATNAMQAMRGAAGQIDIRLDHVLVDAPMADRFQTLQSWRALHPGRAIRLRVSDNGAGMDAVTLERIFEPFFTTKPVDEGTGLGLSVVHGIVQTHEGAITVESTPGAGTVLTLYLPPARARSLAPPRDVPVIDAGTLPEHGSGQHVLYIDDDEALVFLVRRLLERRGYRLSGHVNQREALDALRADPAGFDLVVTDYNMPGMSGLDVARAIRAIRPDLPVVVASGFIDEALRANAPAAGVRELISKTGEAVDLCESLARLAQSLCRKAALT